MGECQLSLPPIISVVGVDGSGKTTLTNWLSGVLIQEGISTACVWSRFRNYLSKPLLALTRLTGHNYYEIHDGIRFGYHDFERLVLYREVFALLQAVDANIGAHFHITRHLEPGKVLICERGPWDTLVDVVSDTGCEWLLDSSVGRLYTSLTRSKEKVILIDRDIENILATRPELVHDPKLERRSGYYRRLASAMNWEVVDNNRTLDEAKSRIAAITIAGRQQQ